MLGWQHVGKKQVAALLGVQTARASTRPRPFLKLLPQNIAVQVGARLTASSRLLQSSSGS